MARNLEFVPEPMPVARRLANVAAHQVILVLARYGLNSTYLGSDGANTARHAAPRDIGIHVERSIALIEEQRQRPSCPSAGPASVCTCRHHLRGR